MYRNSPTDPLYQLTGATAWGWVFHPASVQDWSLSERIWEY